jgi:hypothetical protein
MRIRRVLAVVAAMLAATGLASPSVASGSAAGASTQVEPYLSAFGCHADFTHSISVSLAGGVYRGSVNWEPEQFVSPPGPLWAVSYADGEVRLRVEGRYAPAVLGDPPVQGFVELAAQVAELHPTPVLTGGGAGSGDDNDQQVHLEVRRALELVGTARVTFDNGHVYEVSGCTGSIVTGIMEQSSTPKAQISTGLGTGAWCFPTQNGSRVDELSIDTSLGEPWSLNLVTFDDGGTPDDETDDVLASYQGLSGVTLAQLAGGEPVEFSGSTWPGGEEVQATLTMRWSDLTTSQFSIYSGTSTGRHTVTSGPLLGSVTYGDGTSDSIDCFAYSDSFRVTQAGGGSPATGVAPYNDTPARAISLTGATIVQTSGTALEAEAPNPCTVPTELLQDYRATHTVWFNVTGAGSISIDTAGTRFDTAIAVYTRDSNGRLVDVACNDDHVSEVTPGLFFPTLQAWTRFDAQAGTTYLVQVGGVSADDNYGALRVALGSD